MIYKVANVNTARYVPGIMYKSVPYKAQKANKWVECKIYGLEI